VSAAVHASKLFTTAGSAAAHVWQGNVDRALLVRVAVFGSFGGVLGALLLSVIDGAVLRPFVTLYLAAIGLWLLARSFRHLPKKPVALPFVAPLGTVGGFLDALGGGGWGPVVTTGLIGAGAPPRYAIGTVNTAEFVVTVAVMLTLVFAVSTGIWRQGDGFAALLPAVGGLVCGGLVASPLGALFVRHVREIVLLRTVGLLIVAISLWQTFKALA
jgi:hypothetical protein